MEQVVQMWEIIQDIKENIQKLKVIIYLIKQLVVEVEVLDIH